MCFYESWSRKKPAVYAHMGSTQILASILIISKSWASLYLVWFSSFLASNGFSLEHAPLRFTSFNGPEGPRQTDGSSSVCYLCNFFVKNLLNDQNLCGSLLSLSQQNSKNWQNLVESFLVPCPDILNDFGTIFVPIFGHYCQYFVLSRQKEQAKTPTKNFVHMMDLFLRAFV